MLKTLIQIEGNVNELLTVDNEHNVKMTGFIANPENDVDSSEILSVDIISTDPTRTHPIFNNLLYGKKVRINIEEIIDEN